MQVGVQAIAEGDLVGRGVGGPDDVWPHGLDLSRSVGLGLLRRRNGRADSVGAIPHHFQELLDRMRNDISALGGFEGVPDQRLFANHGGRLVPLLDEVDL